MPRGLHQCLVGQDLLLQFVERPIALRFIELAGRLGMRPEQRARNLADEYKIFVASVISCQLGILFGRRTQMPRACDLAYKRSVAFRICRETPAICNADPRRG
jgi:hypothetical protein